MYLCVVTWFSLVLAISPALSRVVASSIASLATHAKYGGILLP